MDKKTFESVVKEAVSHIKTEHDLSNFKKMLTKLSLEAALEGELYEHLGYSKHERTETGNSRNGISKKTLQTEEGVLEIDVPPRQGQQLCSPIGQKTPASAALHERQNPEPLRQRHDYP